MNNEKNARRMSNSFKKQFDEQGFSFIEMLVAVTIFSIVMLTVTDIFMVGMGGTRRIFNQQAVQESGRFILESMSKELRMSKVNRADSIDYSSLPDGSSGPYAILSITNSSNQAIDYYFNNTAGKQVSRDGAILNANDIEVTGGFYLTKNGTFPPRVTIVIKLNNKTDRERDKAIIGLQTTASSRFYLQESRVITQPADFSLSSSPNSKSFAVSWAARTGNGGVGGCKLQFSFDSCNWIDITSAKNVNCDANSSNASYDLNPDGWKGNWNGTNVRLVRKSDEKVIGIFAQSLSCNSIPGSSLATPTLDEDCDGNWDNYVYIPDPIACLVDTPSTCTAYRLNVTNKKQRRSASDCSGGLVSSGMESSYSDYKISYGESAADILDLNMTQCNNDAAAWVGWIYCDNASYLYINDSATCTQNGTYACTYPVMTAGCANYIGVYY